MASGTAKGKEFSSSYLEGPKYTASVTSKAGYNANLTLLGDFNTSVKDARKRVRRVNGQPLKTSREIIQRVLLGTRRLGV